VLGETASAIAEPLLLDLEDETGSLPKLDADCIVHAAGAVQFKESGRNTAMARLVLKLALNSRCSVYHVGTAFTSDLAGPFRNGYEQDKAEAERLVRNASLPGAIFRPVMLTGNSQSGRIIHASGYYAVIRMFEAMLSRFETLRFPHLSGEINILPVDIAAELIAEAVEKSVRGVWYVKNKLNISAETLIAESLSCMNLSERLHFVSPEEFGRLDLRNEERHVFDFFQPFMPYWSADLPLQSAESLQLAFPISQAYVCSMMSSIQR
jgi:thioester reductase-like protein